MKGTSTQEPKEQITTPEQGEGDVSHDTKPFFTPESEQSEQKTGVSDSPDWLQEAEATIRVRQAIHEAAHPEKKERERTTAKKKIFLDIYSRSMGTITLACEKADIGRTTFYEWRAEDDEFAQAVADIERQRVDMAEDRVFKLIQQDDGPTVRWYLEKVSPKYKARQVLEHHTGENTMEDVVDRMMERIEHGKTPTQTNEANPESADGGEPQATQQA